MESDSKKEVLVSFIIPHHGRDQMLLDTVRSIALQEIEGGIEVLVMTKSADSSVESLRHILTEIVQDGIVDLFTIPPNKTISFGRNTGAARAAGKYLAFIDADVRLAPDWVAEMVRVLDINSRTLLSGAVQKANDDQSVVDLIKSSMSQANAGLVKALPGNALFIKKSVFNAHPKFPEHLETCEDWVFTNTLSMQGEVVLSDRTHFVHLGEDKSYKMLFHKEIWRGTSNFGSITGRKIGLAELPSFVVPPVVGGGLVLSLLCFFIGVFSLAVGILLFSLLAPVLYTLRLKRKSFVPVSFPKVIYFYVVYFSARAVGMVKGLLSSKILGKTDR